MNIVYMDADEIFWRAFSNVRFFDVVPFFKELKKQADPNRINIVVDLHKEYLRPIMEVIDMVKDQYNINIINGYNEAEDKNLTDIVLINNFYQDFMTQGDIKENNYTIVTAGTKYFPMADFIEKFGGNTVSFVLSNDMENLDELSQEYSVVGTMDIAENNMNVFDKTTIREIIRSVQWGEKNKHYLTLRNLIINCEKISNIKPYRTNFVTHALITREVLKRSKLIVNGFIDKTKNEVVKNDKSVEYKVVVSGEQEVMDEFLKTHGITL